MTNKIRGFEPVIPVHTLHNGKHYLPTRASASSAGYDLYTPVGFMLEFNDTITIFTNVKSYMKPGEVLMVFPRSSLGGKGLQLQNTVGIIDSDYYSNPRNDGNIGLMLKNTSAETLYIKPGDRIAQGIFIPYLLADGDDVSTHRDGGFGSSGS